MALSLLSSLAACASAPHPGPASPGVPPGDSVAPAASAGAPNATSAPTPDSWAFTGSAYAWLAKKRGVIESGSIGVPLDDPDESLGAFAYVEGTRDRWGFVADLSLMNAEDRSEIPTGTVEIDEDTIAGELDVTYRPGDDPTLRFLAGLRVLDSSSLLRFPIAPDVSNDVTQLDPVVGAQGSWPLGESFAFRLRGDVGGFGVDSKLTYQGLGLFAWEFSEGWMLTGGYRTLGWEFEEDGVKNDVRLSGFLFGVAATF